MQGSGGANECVLVGGRREKLQDSLRASVLGRPRGFVHVLISEMEALLVAWVPADRVDARNYTAGYVVRDLLDSTVPNAAARTVISRAVGELVGKIGLGGFVASM